MFLFLSLFCFQKRLFSSKLIKALQQRPPIPHFLLFLVLDLFVDTWLTCVGLIHIFVEFPRSFWNARIQDPVFKWARFMERLWGRALMLLMFSILMMSDSGNPLKIVLGVPAFLASFVNLLIR
jgi:hypothetical protein